MKNKKKNPEIKFKVGDKVQVVDCIPDDWCDDPFWVSRMNTLLGRVGKITYIDIWELYATVSFFGELGVFPLKLSWLQRVTKEK